MSNPESEAVENLRSQLAKQRQQRTVAAKDFQAAAKRAAKAVTPQNGTTQPPDDEAATEELELELAGDLKQLKNDLDRSRAKRRHGATAFQRACQTGLEESKRYDIRAFKKAE